MAQSKEWAVKLRPQTLEQMAGQESNKLIFRTGLTMTISPTPLSFMESRAAEKLLWRGCWHT